MLSKASAVGNAYAFCPPAVLWRQARSHWCAVVASLWWALSCCDQRPLECRYQHILTLVKGPDRQQLAAHFLAVVCGLNGGGFGCLSGPQACCNLRKSIAHLPVACSPGTLVASGPPSSIDIQLMNRRIVFRGERGAIGGGGGGVGGIGEGVGGVGGVLVGLAGFGGVGGVWRGVGGVGGIGGGAGESGDNGVGRLSGGAGERTGGRGEGMGSLLCLGGAGEWASEDNASVHQLDIC